MQISHPQDVTPITAQYDSGENIIITNDKNSIYNIHPVTPFAVTHLSDLAPPIQVHSMGKVSIQTEEGNIFWTLIYYCEDASHTILSPD